MRSESNHISIIIPNYNGSNFLKTCFDSIDNQSRSCFEIILIDDCSTDDSVSFVKKNYPSVEVIQKKKNSGFPSSVNIGIKAAKGNLVALLNNDTELDKDWVEEIINAVDTYPDADFFASKMLDFKNRSIIDSCGDGMSWAGRGYKIGTLEKNVGQYDQEKFVFGACAGAAVYKKEVFDKIGLFDEDFSFYLEDVDIDFRAQLAGLRCLFVPKAKVYHIGSATAGKRSAFSYKMMIKNHFHLIYKNFPIARICKNIFKIIYSELRFLAAGVKHGFTKEYFWAVGKAIKEHDRMRPKRKIIQSNIKVSSRYLDSIIDQDFKYKSLADSLNTKE